MKIEQRWNDTDGENGRTRRETCPSDSLYTTNGTWTDLGMKTGLGGENPVSNRLSYSTASVFYTPFFYF
jgi:hypothetical protein